MKDTDEIGLDRIEAHRCRLVEMQVAWNLRHEIGVQGAAAQLDFLILAFDT